MRWYKGMIIAKDPDSVLDWQWDFADWLATGDTVISHSVVADSGITVDASVDDTTSVTVWLSGGTAGETYTVTVRAVTADGRTVDRSVDFEVSAL